MIMDHHMHNIMTRKTQCKTYEYFVWIHLLRHMCRSHVNVRGFRSFLKLLYKLHAVPNTLIVLMFTM